MVISELTFELKDISSNKKITKPLDYSSGVVFHSVFLELVKYASEEFASNIHSLGNSQRPYHILIPKLKNDKIVWSIYGLTNGIFELFRILAKKLVYKPIEIGHYKLTWQIESISVKKSFTYTELVDRYYTSSAIFNDVDVFFSSPTCFKDNQTSFFLPIPYPRLIIQSALKKWNSFAEEIVKLEHDNMLDDLSNSMFLKKYNLTTRTFQLNEITIPGFLGRASFGLRGPSQTKNLIKLLLKYISFSGVGIKTAMGMGDVKLAKDNNHKTYQTVTKTESSLLV